MRRPRNVKCEALSSCEIQCCVHGRPCSEDSEAAALQAFQRLSNEKKRDFSSGYCNAKSPKKDSSASKKPQPRKNHYENILNLAKMEVETRLPRAVDFSRPRHRHSKESDKYAEIAEQEVAALYKQYYLGVQSSKQAEKRCADIAQFRLYHRIDDAFDLGGLKTNLRLHIVYLNSKGVFRHFRIVEKPAAAPGNDPYLAVDYGDPKATLFGSLHALLRHYSTYALVNEDSTIDLFRDASEKHN